MLEVSQLDNTSAELPRKLLDISKIIRAEMEHLPVKEGVEYRLKLAAPEIVFPLHRSYVSLLVRELLKNAVKFTEQGSVTVKCGLTGSDTLTLSVTDTGCGVEPGLAEKIFDRFYKGDPFAQGLGLGLSLCRLIVEKLGRYDRPRHLLYRGCTVRGDAPGCLTCGSRNGFLTSYGVCEPAAGSVCRPVEIPL